MTTPEKNSFSPAFKKSITPGKSPKRFLYSPSWKNRRFKVRNPKVKSNLVVFQSQTSQFISSEPEKENDSNFSNSQPAAGFTKIATKRKNPFSCLSSNTKRHCDEAYGLSNTADDLKTRDKNLTGQEAQLEVPEDPSLRPPTSPSLFDDESPKAERKNRVSFSSDVSSQPVYSLPVSSQQFVYKRSDSKLDQNAAKTYRTVERLPRHLTLRSKVKIISASSLYHLKKATHVLEPCLDVSLESDRELADHCAYWMHPYIPWLKLFPRYTSKAAVKDAQNTSFLTDALNNDIFSAWNVSFQSAYDLLRSGNLELFFLCSSNMTMCFESFCRESQGNLNSRNVPIKIHIVPTTNGFRDTLFKQKIKFSKPYLDDMVSGQKLEPLRACSSATNLKEASFSSEGKLEENDCFESNTNDLDCSREDPEDLLQDQASCQDWLNVLGCEKVQVSSQKSTQSFENENKYDYTKQSAIVISSDSVHQFFNFLLNFKSLIPSSGALAGLPPTILSCKPFSGATLQQLNLKVKDYKANFKDVKERRKEYSFEIYNGPILPSVFNTLIHKIRDKLNSSVKFECHSTFAENSDAFDKDSLVPPVFECIEKKFLLPNEK